MDSLVTSHVPERVYSVLDDIGIPAHLSGYDYIAYSLHLQLSDPEYSRAAITKYLYPDVANKFNSTPSRVERAIRHAINHVIIHTPVEIIRKYFGNSVGTHTEFRITNNHFICTLAKYILRNN